MATGSDDCSSLLSWAMPSSICCSTPRIFFSSFALFRSTVLRHTNVYLLATDSTFVPSMYCTSRLSTPSSTKCSTTWTNSPLIWSFTCPLRKRLIVLYEGCSLPDSHM